MNLQSYFYNCSPDYVDSIDPSIQVQITSIITQIPKQISALSKVQPKKESLK